MSEFMSEFLSEFMSDSRSELDSLSELFLISQFIFFPPNRSSPKLIESKLISSKEILSISLSDCKFFSFS